MKKTPQKLPFFRRLAILVPLLLLAGIAAMRAVELHEARVGHPLSMAINRHVENVTCSGKCTGAVLVSDQEPDVRYYDSATETPLCSEAVLWANTNGREDQVVFGGYEFVNGYQVNLRTQTFGLDVLTGKDIEFTLPDDDLFTARIADTGEWNLLDSVVCNELMCSGLTRIFTDRDAGRVKLYDSCDTSADHVKMYTLYQAPEVHGPDTDDTYRVDVGLRALPSTGSTTGMVDGVGFTRVYASSELTDDVVHVVADVGDATFEFDLVKDVE